MMRRPFVWMFAAAVTFAVSCVPGQREIATGFGSAPYSVVGDNVVGIGDGNGDGVPEFLVYRRQEPPVNTPGVQLFDGASRSPIASVWGAGSEFGLQILTAAGDMNLDGHADFLIGGIQAHSGADGSLLWTSTVLGSARSATSIRDIDGDGRAEVAAYFANGGNGLLAILRGSDGTQLAGLPFSNSQALLATVGDVDGDGFDEIAMVNNGPQVIYRTSPLQLLRSLGTPQGSWRGVTAANVADSAAPEAILIRNGSMLCYSTTTGALRRTIPLRETEVAFLGDLDGDGFDDFATLDNRTQSGYLPTSYVAIRSGATGALLSHWGRSAQIGAQELAGVGDVDGDGFGDLLIGDSNASPNPNVPPSRGAWQLVSGRILADTHHFAVQCHGGPFPPRLGMTRPILGSNVTFVGLDCPPTAFGTLALSLRPEFPVNLGFTGCDAWWNPGNWSIVHQPPATASWSYSLPLPAAPELAGLQVALQAFYVPTTSPIGFDLSNGIWARLGF